MNQQPLMLPGSAAVLFLLGAQHLTRGSDAAMSVQQEGD